MAARLPAMPATEKLHYSVDIAAPVQKVWETMFTQETYRDWTTAFSPGSRYVGSWDQGAKIRFLGAGDDEGMLSEIAENRKHEFVSIRHLGMLVGGKEDYDSPAVRAWAGAYENYTFQPIPGGTRLVIDQDMQADYVQFMNEAWPKALARLKALSEGAAKA